MRARIALMMTAVLAVASAGSAGEKLAVQVPMSDGVRLATDVYLPRGGAAAPAPVVLLRTPYNKSSGGSRGLTAMGYAVVVQDMRGRFASEGENLPFVGCGWVKHRDGADTIDWIRRQKWCNGRVATAGGSALGITQGLLAGAQPKGLACQYIQVAAGSLYHHAAYVGGALRKSQVERWLQSNRFDAKALKMYAEHPCYDEFWHAFDSTRKHGVMTAPAMHVGGWFDTFSQGTIDSFVGRQHQGGPGAKGNQKLVMGPWAHGGFRGGRVGELRFPGARHPAKYSATRWLAAWMKDEKNGAKEMLPVAYYVMGNTDKPGAPGNEWRFAKDWPIPAAPTDYYLHADGTLSTKKPPAREGKPAAAGYTFDPSDPCPTVGGCNLVLPSGPMDQGRAEQRKDVLAFTTAPLAEPVEVTGRVAAKLTVTSTAADTDLSVRFCDVYPNGKSYLMAEGMLRLRYRDGFVKPKLMTRGQSYNVTVSCWSTSVVLDTGHRIRVTITSSNYPRFDLNPGTGKPWRGPDKAVRQTNSITCGGSSRIVLPVVRHWKAK